MAETPYALRGALTWSNADQVLRQPGLLQATAVDLSGVTQADTSALALLLELQRRAQVRGVRLELKNAPAQLLGMGRFFDVDSLLSL